MDAKLTFKDHLLQHSKSQQAEDNTLFTKYFCGVVNGTYLELGALDGWTYSNTYAFEYGAGWRGLLIEASPASFAGLIHNRADNICMNAAVCDQFQTVHYALEGHPPDGTRHPATGGILEFMSDEFLRSWHPKAKDYTAAEAPAIPCYPLGALLQLSGLRHFQFFSLDVEGGELQVLQSINFNSVAFDVIFVEAQAQVNEKQQAVRTLLQSKGYRFVEHMSNSDWFVREGWSPRPCA